MITCGGVTAADTNQHSVAQHTIMSYRHGWGRTLSAMPDSRSETNALAACAYCRISRMLACSTAESRILKISQSGTTDSALPSHGRGGACLKSSARLKDTGTKIIVPRKKVRRTCLPNTHIASSGGSSRMALDARVTSVPGYPSRSAAITSNGSRKTVVPSIS